MRAALPVLLVFTAACAPLRLDAPPPPRPEAPAFDEPSDPVPEGKSRVVFDVVDGPARVSRIEPRKDAPLIAFTSIETKKEGEVLCISPCVLDLEPGEHEIAFTSQADPSRTSEADVQVTDKPSGKPIVVRHALGKNTPASEKYRDGALRTVIGGSLFVAGGIATTLGFINNTAPGSGIPDHMSVGPAVLLGTGLVAMVSGLILGGVGISEMTSNRPVEQSGSTTTWKLDDGRSAANDGK